MASFDFKTATPSTTQLVAGNFLMGAASQAAATPTLYDAKVLPLISGNFTATLTITGNTNVTLPTTGTLAILGANTFTAGQTVTEAVGASALTLTGATQTSSFPVINTSQTWNASGTTFTGWLLNVTKTAAAAASVFVDWQIAGSSQMKIDTNGVMFGGGNSGFTLGGGVIAATGGSKVMMINSGQFGFCSGAASQATSPDTIYTRAGAASWQHGAADADTGPVAQTIRSQGALAGGTSDVAGANFTFIASPGKGTGAGGQFIFQTAPAGSTGTVVNAVATGLTITAPAVNMQPSVVVGNQALATTATAGFLYIPTCAGTPTGVPTSSTGRIPMVYDTTNHQFWFYDSSWKQPKTPAGAATVTWQ